MTMTYHASNRAKNRCINDVDLEIIENYGSERYDHKGALIMYISNKVKKQLQSYFKQFCVNSTSRIKNCYFVESIFDGVIITVGHRTKRIYNN